MDAFEQAVADELTRKGWAVFVPHKDQGVDLVALPSLEQTSAVRLQVKGSRTYGPRFQGWYKFRWDKVEHAMDITDFWVFVCFVTSPKGRFHPQFAVVPSSELKRRLEADKGDPVHFYLTEHWLDGERHLVNDRKLPRKKLSKSEISVAPALDFSEFWSGHGEDVWRKLHET
jgi:hypothetical protein